jgi:diketogulonate reductase-like aldo/keto reductase
MERRVKLPAGEEVPALGQGTWKMAEDRARRADELAALRLGIELGMTLIDTAEMYGEGKTEELVGEAIVGLRDRVFLVSKVYPHNASRVGVAQACERSLRRLKTDRLDLYLLHWPGSVPIAETVEGFEALKRAGKIRHWGVSNFDADEMKELFEVPGGRACATNQILYNLSRRGPEYDLLLWPGSVPIAETVEGFEALKRAGKIRHWGVSKELFEVPGGRACATKQILYNLSRRGPEYDLLPWMEERGLPTTAYSPIEQGRLRRSGALDEIGRKHGATLYQIALAWVMRRPDVIAIPKAARAEHVRENRTAAGIVLDEHDLSAIDAAYAPPKRKKPLEMI